MEKRSSPPAKASGEHALSQAPAIPDLDVPHAVRTRSSGAMPAVVPSRPPESNGGRAAAPNIVFDGDYGDMPIERNIVVTESTTPSAVVSIPPTSATYRTSLSTGLASSRRPAHAPRIESSSDTPSRIAGVAVTFVIGMLTFSGLFRFAHPPGGRPLAHLFPHAFDGTSAPESAVIAIVALLVAATLGFIGLRLRPFAWSFVASAITTLLLALAMVTVTLASTDENGVPPDGAILVPYLLSVALVLASLGVALRASSAFTHLYGIRRAKSIILALASGILAFAALEVLGF